MKKSLDSLVERFKTIEKELIEILNEKQVDFESIEEKTALKKALKDYIKKVKKAKKLFSEYEEIAKKIEDISSDEGDSQSLSLEVLDEKNEKFFKYIAQGVGFEGETSNVKNSGKKTKKTLKTKAPVKEF